MENLRELGANSILVVPIEKFGIRNETKNKKCKRNKQSRLIYSLIKSYQKSKSIIKDVKNVAMKLLNLTKILTIINLKN